MSGIEPGSSAFCTQLLDMESLSQQHSCTKANIHGDILEFSIRMATPHGSCAHSLSLDPEFQETAM